LRAERSDVCSHLPGLNALYGGQMEEGDSFAELYAAVGPRLWRAVFVYTGGQREMTDDVVAEAFARTLERRDSVRDRAGYAYRSRSGSPPPNCVVQQRLRRSPKQPPRRRTMIHTRCSPRSASYPRISALRSTCGTRQTCRLMMSPG
jgi:hypothetical protein